jgi:lipid A disaccharide synthetase
VQNAAEPQAIAHEMQRILRDADYAQKIKNDLAEVQTRLGTADGVNTMAQLACEMLSPV